MDLEALCGFAQLARLWPEPMSARVPAWIYTDPELFERELAVFHRGANWNWIGLECEIPRALSCRLPQAWRAGYRRHGAATLRGARRRCVGDLRAADSRPGRVPWPEASRLIDRIFNGRPLRLLGYDRQLLVLAHRTLAAAPEAAMGAEMGGRETRPNQFLTTENQIRVFYPMYGRDMGIGAASDLTNGAAAK